MIAEFDSPSSDSSGLRSKSGVAFLDGSDSKIPSSESNRNQEMGIGQGRANDRLELQAD